MLNLTKLFSSIGIDKDYSTMDFGGLQEDVQGWGNDHPIFEQVISKFKPNLVIELGTWKGASLIRMASLTKSLALPTQFICVDTWLGSSEHWLNPEWRNWLMLQNGYPSLFRQFIFNINNRKLVDDVFPLPMTSSAAAYFLKEHGVVADVIYIDADHKEEEVSNDLKSYYDLLKPGGAMFGDDYSQRWNGVVKAVDQFVSDKGLILNTTGDKWLFVKPLE